MTELLIIEIYNRIEGGYLDLPSQHGPQTDADDNQSDNDEESSPQTQVGIERGREVRACDIQNKSYNQQSDPDDQRFVTHGPTPPWSGWFELVATPIWYGFVTYQAIPEPEWGFK